MYYPYNDLIESVFETPQPKQEFGQKLIALANDANAAGIESMNYLITGKRSSLERPEGYKTRIQQDLYEILSADERV